MVGQLVVIDPLCQSDSTRSQTVLYWVASYDASTTLHTAPRLLSHTEVNMFEAWSLVYTYSVEAGDEQAASLLRGVLRGLSRLPVSDDNLRQNISKLHERHIDLLPVGLHRSPHDVPMSWWVSDFLKESNTEPEECCCELFTFPMAKYSLNSKTPQRQNFHDEMFQRRLSEGAFPTFDNYMETQNCCSCIHDEQGRIIVANYKLSLMGGKRCVTGFLLGAAAKTCMGESKYLRSVHRYPCVRHGARCACDICHPVFPPKRFPVVQELDSDQPTYLVSNPMKTEQSVTVPAHELMYDSQTRSYIVHEQSSVEVVQAINDISRLIPTCDTCIHVCLCECNTSFPTKLDSEGRIMCMYSPNCIQNDRHDSSYIRHLPLSVRRFHDDSGVGTIYLLELDKAFYVCHRQFMDMQIDRPNLQLFFPPLLCPSQTFLKSTFLVPVQVLQTQLVWKRRGLEECISDIICNALHTHIGKAAEKFIFTGIWHGKACIDLNARTTVATVQSVPITNAVDDGFYTGMFFSATELMVFKRSVALRHPVFAYRLFHQDSFGQLMNDSYTAVVGDVHTYQQKHGGPDVESFFNIPHFSDCSVHDNLSWCDKLYQGHFTRKYAKTFCTDRRMHFLNSAPLVVFCKLSTCHNCYDIFPFGYTYDDDDEDWYEERQDDWTRNCDPNNVTTVLNNNEMGICDYILSSYNGLYGGIDHLWPNIRAKLTPDETAYSSLPGCMDNMVSLLASLTCFESYADLWDGPRLHHNTHSKGNRTGYKMMKEFSASFLTSLFGNYRFRSNLVQQCNNMCIHDTHLNRVSCERSKKFILNELIPAMDTFATYQGTLNDLTRKTADSFEVNGHVISVDAMALDPTYFWHVCTLLQKINDNTTADREPPFYNMFDCCSKTKVNLTMYLCLVCLLRSAFLCNSKLFQTFMDFAFHCADKCLTNIILMSDFQAAIMLCVSFSETPDVEEALRIVAVVEEMYTRSLSLVGGVFEFLYLTTYRGHFGKLPPDTASFGLCFCIVNWRFQHAVKLLGHINSPNFVLSQPAYFRSRLQYSTTTLLDVKRFYERLCMVSASLNADCNSELLKEKLLWAGIDAKDLYDSDFMALGSTFCMDRCCKYQSMYATTDNKENVKPGDVSEIKPEWNPERMTFMCQGKLYQHFCNCILCCPFADEKNIMKETGNKYLNRVNHNFIQLVCADTGNMTRHLTHLEDMVFQRTVDTYSPIDLYPFLVTKTVGIRDGLLKLIDMKVSGKCQQDILPAVTLDYQIMAYLIVYCHHMQWVLHIMVRRFDFAIASLSSRDLHNLYVTWSRFVSPGDNVDFVEPGSVLCIPISPLMDHLKNPCFYPYADVCHTSMVRKLNGEVTYCDMLKNSKAVEAIMHECYTKILNFKCNFEVVERVVNQVRGIENTETSRRTLDCMFLKSTITLDEMVALNINVDIRQHTN